MNIKKMGEMDMNKKMKGERNCGRQNKNRQRDR